MEKFAEKYGKDKVTPNTVVDEKEVTVTVIGKNGTYNYKIGETEIKIADNTSPGKNPEPGGGGATKMD